MNACAASSICVPKAFELIGGETPKIQKSKLQKQHARHADSFGVWDLEFGPLSLRLSLRKVLNLSRRELARVGAPSLAKGMDKARLQTAITEKLRAELETITRAALMARDEATHEESKAENQYDMHAQEAAYLAEGQAKLAVELNETLHLYQALKLSDWLPDAPAGIGAVVTLQAGQRTARYFIGPRSGGLELQLDGEEFTVVTPSSPLGRQLVGAKVNSVVQLPGRAGTAAYRVIQVE